MSVISQEPSLALCNNVRIGTHFHFKFENGYVTMAFISLMSGRQALYRALKIDQKISMQEWVAASKKLKASGLPEVARQENPIGNLHKFIVLFAPSTARHEIN